MHRLGFVGAPAASVQARQVGRAVEERVVGEARVEQ
jgi:hypothetical protein